MIRPQVDFDPVQDAFLQKVSKALVLNCVVRNTALAGFITEDQLTTITRECVDNIFTALRCSLDLPDAPDDWPEAKINSALVRQEQVKPVYVRQAERAAMEKLPRIRSRRRKGAHAGVGHE